MIKPFKEDAIITGSSVLHVKSNGVLNSVTT